MRRLYILPVLLVLSAFFMGAKPPKTAKNRPTDAASSEVGPRPYYTPRKYKSIKSSSQYLTMRDGVKIAVNLSLPADLPEGEKIPVILYQTRYWRGAQFNWPFNAFLNNFSGKTGKLMKEVILRGYALVAVDARGSGASLGSRKHPWTEDEVADGYEITEWAVKQPWCNGNAGSAGISYSGTTAEFLATTGHPAIKAVVPMFSLYDVYDDISLPGGLSLDYFTQNWGYANRLLDNNKLPVKNIMAKMAVGGVQPVKGERKMRKEAIRQHQANLSVADGVKSIVHRDDISKADGVTSPDKFSPHTKSHLLDRHGVAVYGISGYYDGNYQHAAIKRFLSLNNPKNKLLLGPWEHGGWMNCSPHNPGPAAFDKAFELLKFFDYHLKGIENGLYDEPRIHYYTLGEEKWKSTTVWPPENTAYEDYYLTAAGALSKNMQADNMAFAVMKADSTFGTGEYTRWRSLLGKLNTPFAYTDWSEKSRTLLHFTSPPLPADVVVTGHPVIHLYTMSHLEDGAYFAYLQEVTPEGKAIYVTEGQLRALHRAISKDKRNHRDVEQIPHHTYLKKDAMPVTPGKKEYIAFDLYPVSHRFRKGHSIRVSLSAADRDHFKNIMAWGDRKIFQDSYLSLPVEK